MHVPRSYKDHNANGASVIAFSRLAWRMAGQPGCSMVTSFASLDVFILSELSGLIMHNRMATVPSMASGHRECCFILLANFC
jgi:hypothetical protein